MSDRLLIPPREIFEVTHDDDPLDWYYKPFIRQFYLYRFKMVLGLIAETVRPLSREGRVLDVGFASGFLFPSLQKYFKELHGADIHPKVNIVKNGLKRKGNVFTKLVTANAIELPYKNAFFDYTIAVSLLEQIKKLDLAISELTRVTKKGGGVIIGFPTKNALMHILFRILLLGRSDDSFHVSSHLDILDSIKRHLHTETIEVMPRGFPLSLAMYVVCLCRHKKN